jgi:hypothetical protein
VLFPFFGYLNLLLLQKVKNMLKKWPKSAIFSSLVLAIVACTNTVPNNNPSFKKDNFQDLDKEYHFTTEALTESYLKRKINFWLDPPAKGSLLVKEITYGIAKYRDTLCDVISADNNLLLDEINLVQEVQDRSSVDTTFGAFLTDCNTSTPTFGSEFRVNTYTTDQQLFSDVAMDNSGNFVVTWSSRGQDGSAYGVFAQRYNSVGVPLGTEFQVNTFTTSNQAASSVAMDDAGDFVISWSGGGNGEDGSGIFARMYNAGGIPQGTELNVNTYTTGSQGSPSVAMDGAGDFVISWQSNGQDGDVDGFGNLKGNIYAQRFNSGGIPQGTEFRVNTYTTNYQVNPSVAMDDAGDFVISWDSQGQDGDLVTRTNIYAQRYNAGGVPQNTEFRVNNYTTNFQRFPSVVMDFSGDFVITWFGDGNGDGSGGIFAQRFNSSGIPQGTEFRVNTYTSNLQSYPSIAMDDTGDFVVTWTSGVFSGESQDGSSYGIFAQRYDSTGSSSGTEFQVNTYTTSFQFDSSTAMDSNGNFVITWTSPEQDLSGYGVYGQRYNSSGAPQ